MKASELKISFVVREDLPSERVQQYRNLIIRGLKELQCEGNLSTDEHEMIDRLFRDYHDGETLEYVVSRRKVVRKIEEMSAVENPDYDEIKKLEKLDEALEVLIGD